jgi:hypothetical protein
MCRAFDDDLDSEVDDFTIEEDDHVFMVMVHPVDPHHFVCCNVPYNPDLRNATYKLASPPICHLSPPSLPLSLRLLPSLSLPSTAAFFAVTAAAVSALTATAIFAVATIIVSIIATVSIITTISIMTITAVVVTDLLDQQDKLVRRLLLVVEFKFCRGGGCSFDQLTEQ